MSEDAHLRVFQGFIEMDEARDWGRFGDYWHSDCVLEFPQSGERFRGLDNVRAQFSEYPGIEASRSELHDLISESPAYALGPTYTIIGVDGTGNRGTAVIRVRYPDDSRWYAINIYELRDGLIYRCRSFFAPDFEAPDWRAPFREAP